MEREGVVAMFDSSLALDIFAGNSLAHVGGLAPYDVVFGRWPSMQPPLEIDGVGEAVGHQAPGADPDGAAGSKASGAPAGGGIQPSWLQWRARESVLRRMIEATSI